VINVWLERRILQLVREGGKRPRDIVTSIDFIEERVVRYAIRDLIERGSIAPGLDWTLKEVV